MPKQTSSQSLSTASPVGNNVLNPGLAGSTARRPLTVLGFVLQGTPHYTGSWLQNDGSLVIDSQRSRPYWFDGRFLAARDLQREQDYFLQRQADLGQAAGFSVIHGLWVDTPAANDTGATPTR